MTDVAFGVFDWIDRAAEPLRQLYEERLQLLELADSAGFFCYHLAEHHATPLGMAPSPALFLSAAAQRTRRIRLGPLVYLLPLYNPLRLIEEVSMLDQLSGGGWNWVSAVASSLTNYAITGSIPTKPARCSTRLWRCSSPGSPMSVSPSRADTIATITCRWNCNPCSTPIRRCGTRRTILTACGMRLDTATILSALAPLRQCAGMSIFTGRPGNLTAVTQDGSMPMLRRPKSESCARSLWRTPTAKRWRPPAQRITTGTARSRSCGTTTVTTASTVSSGGIWLPNTRRSSSARRLAYENRCHALSKQAAAITSSAHFRGARCRTSRCCTQCACSRKK